jgi:hypothetical protein
MGNMIAVLRGLFHRIERGDHPFLAPLALCLAVLVAYIQVWPNEFLFNDGILISQNKFLRDWAHLPDLLTQLCNAGYGLPGGFYRPVEMFIYFLVYQVFGSSTVAYHTLNLALHALNACLLYRLGQRIGFSKGVVFAAALLWTLHPLHTSNVAYMSSTSELLWGTFGLAGLLTLLPDFAPRQIWKALVLFLLALGCKESAVVFPALAAATFFLVSKDRLKITVYLKLWPLWLVSACYIALWLLFMHKTDYVVKDVGDLDYIHNGLNRLFTFLAALPVYLRLLVWPSDLHIHWIYPTFTTLWAWQPLAGLLVVGLSLGQIFMQILTPAKSRRGLVLSFGLLWAAISISPYSGIVTPVDAVIAEGWLYVPMMGLFLVAADTVAGLLKKRQRAAQMLTGALALALGLVTFLEVPVWRTPNSLYENNVRHQNWTRPEKNYLLGMFYLGRSNFDLSITQFVEQISSPAPDIHRQSAHLWLAMALLQVEVRGNIVTQEALLAALPHSLHVLEAIRELGMALKINPDFHEVHTILSVIYRYQGNSQMADFHQKKAADILQRQAGSSP